MKGGDIFGLVIAVTLLLAMVWGVTYVTAHANGYYQGARTTKLYYEATSEFPTESWLEDFEANYFLFPQEILETLQPYGGR